MGISESERDSLVALRLAFSFFSLLGSLFIMFSILLFRQWHKIVMRLVWILSATVALKSIANLWTPGVYSSDGLCYAQALTIQLAEMGTFVWMAIIAFTCTYAVYTARPSIPWVLEAIFHVIAWPLVIFSAIPPLFTNDYGDSGVWCWIDNSETGNIWRFVCFYVPAWCYIFFILLMYTLLVGRVIFVFRGMNVRRKGARAKIKFNLKISQLLIYPLLFVCLWVFPAVNRIHDWAHGDDTENYGLLLMHVLSAASQGIFNCLVYGLDKEIRKRYYNLFKKIWRFITCKTSTTASLMRKEKYVAQLDEEQLEEGETPITPVFLGTVSNDKSLNSSALYQSCELLLPLGLQEDEYEGRGTASSYEEKIPGVSTPDTQQVYMP